MNAIQEVQRLASQQTEVEKLRAIAKSAATVLTKMGYPTQVIFGEARGGRTPSGGSPGGRPKGKAGKKAKGKKVRVKKDGTYEVVYDDDDDGEDDGGYEQDAMARDAMARDAGGFLSDGQGFLGYDAQVR